MHETALVRDVVRRIEDLARSTGARQVTGAKVWLGALSHLSAEHFREHFAIEAQGSIAAAATLPYLVLNLIVLGYEMWTLIEQPVYFRYWYTALTMKGDRRSYSPTPT